MLIAALEALSPRIITAQNGEYGPQLAAEEAPKVKVQLRWKAFLFPPSPTWERRISCYRWSVVCMGRLFTPPTFGLPVETERLL